MLGQRRDAAPLALSLEDWVGNQAVARALRGEPYGIAITPEFLSALRRKGVWREQALPRLRPEDLQGVMDLRGAALPPQFDLGSSPAPANEGHKDDEFVVASDEFGVTIVHPATETRIRAVEEEHRYKPEEWTYETVNYPKDTPSISYQLIAPEEDKPGEVLMAIGPGAYVEVEEPAPFEGAKEWELTNWQPRMGGRFDVTIVEMPDNALVPLPNQTIDVATLLKAGGKMHYPDKHTWRGAISYQGHVMTIATLIADLVFAAIPFVGELAEAATLGSEAAALSPELEGTAALGGLDVGPSTGAALDEAVAATSTEAFSPAELGVLNEARSIVASPEFAQIGAANKAGESVVVNIGGRIIQYEPGLPASGMTMFGENGFLIGPEAFASESELNQTVLHELYRLSFSESAEGVSGGLATQETNAAASFAARAAGLLR